MSPNTLFPSFKQLIASKLSVSNRVPASLEACKRLPGLIQKYTSFPQVYYLKFGDLSMCHPTRLTVSCIDSVLIN